MKRFSGRWTISVSCRSIWTADPRQTGYRLFLVMISWTLCSKLSETAPASHSDWTVFVLSTFQHFFNAHYIIQGKQLIRLPSAVFEWASCAAMQGWSSSFRTVGHKQEKPVSQRTGLSSEELPDERYEEVTQRNKAKKGCKTDTVWKEGC